MEGRVGQVGEAVGGGAGGATRRRAHLLGGRDGGDGPLPGQQGGQEGRLGRGGASGRGRGAKGGRSRQGGRGLRPVSPILRHGDGLERRSMGDGGKLSGGAMEEEEKKKNDGVKMSESVMGVQSAECASDASTRGRSKGGRGRSNLPDVQQNMFCIYLLR